MLFTPDLQLEFLEMEEQQQMDFWPEEEEEGQENLEQELDFPLPF